MFLKLKKLDDKAIIPTPGSDESGYDIYVLPGVSEIIQPHQTAEIPTGIALEIPIGYIGLLFARHNLAAKEGLAPANCVGHITSDFKGEVTISLHNFSSLNSVIKGGERIAELVVVPYLAFEGIEEVHILRQTKRGASGYGSTGK
jgi:dUTP pyrophosphatase